MKKNNKFVAILLSGAMAISLAACGGSSTSTTENTSVAESTVSEAAEASDATTEAEAAPEEIEALGDLASAATTGSTEIAAEEGDGISDIVTEDDYVYNSINSEVMLEAIQNIDADSIVDEDADSTEENAEDGTASEGVISDDTGKLGSYSSSTFSTGYTYLDGYTNEFFGIDFTLPSGWVMGNSYDLTEINEGFSGALSDSDTKAAVDNGDIITVMVAASESGYNFATVDILNREVVFPYATSADDIFYSMQSAYSSYYTSLGYTDVSVAITTFSFMGGSDVGCIEISAKDGSNPFYKKEIYATSGSYIACISVITDSVDFTSVYMNSFGSL